MADWVVIAYATVFPVLAAFAIFACITTYAYERKRTKQITTEEFITARGSQNALRIAFSFYAGAVGSWVVTGPPSYAVWSGLLGLGMYSLWAGFPILFIAFLGDKVTANLPEVLSLSHYMEWRFGRVSQTIVILISLLNMCIALLAEYSAMGSLFKDYVGTTSLPIILYMGVLTMAYTAYGGLRVSILTDRVQAIASMVLLLILAVYIGVDFRPELGPVTDDLLGLNYAGYSSIISMPVSLTTATVFNEAMWQRVWASESKRALHLGAGMACVAVMLVVFMFGMGGFLANWAGLVTEDTNPNLYFFQLFAQGQPYMHTVTGLLTLLTAAIMSESAIDSAQNGINGIISSTFLKDRSVTWSRLFVVVCNVVLLAMAATGIASTVLSLFLVGNMICASTALPVVSGLIPGATARRLITESSVVIGMAVAVVTVTCYGIATQWVASKDAGSNIAHGIVYAWYGNGYAWEYFVIALASSVVGQGIGVALFALFPRVFAHRGV